MDNDKIGIFGTGHLASHVVPGLLRGLAADRILLSPRGAQTSQQLAQQYGLDVAANNGELVQRSSTILLAVRPFQLEEACSGLPWREDQLVVSLCAGVSIDTLRQHIPGPRIARSIPVTAAMFGASPSTLYPRDPEARELISHLGPVVEAEDEAQFESMAVAATFYGWLQKLTGVFHAEIVGSGVPPEAARLLVSQMMVAAGTAVREQPEMAIEDLVQDLCLPGSYTGHGLDVLLKANAFAPWREAYNAVLKKANGDSG